ncbi:MAG TPA: response regulator, partial [Sphingobacteriaceae bacterium]|nr:response regulator [Sphingobacteriaceae bacterium]
SEISKLNLTVPQDYADNHAIANEWAINRWAETLGIADDWEVEDVFRKVETNIYFKYLKTIFPVQPSHKLSDIELCIPNSNAPKVLLIDDEAHKGWNGLFAHLMEKNKIYSDYIETDFRHQEPEEIIKQAVQQIKKDRINIVLLDFRLSPLDFENKPIEEMTSVKLLTKIKEINNGIQVIIFSATNKVWNLQKLLELGADGFVMKEAPENTVDPAFTKNSIVAFTNALTKAVRRIFLIDVFSKLSQIKKNLKQLDYEEDTKYHNFIMGLQSQLKVITASAKSIDLESRSTLDIVFLNCFNFLERYKIDYYSSYQDYRYYLGAEEVQLNRYRPTKKGAIDEGIFIPNNKNDAPSWFHMLAALFIDYFEICGLKDAKIISLNNLKDHRNDFIHNKKLHFKQSELFEILAIMEVVTIKMKE